LREPLLERRVVEDDAPGLILDAVTVAVSVGDGALGAPARGQAGQGN
jgi:hypothetical protein